MSELSAPAREKIESLVKQARVVLFMKGVRHAPQCGFSASVVEILDGWLDEYATVDVLADPTLREDIKLFSDWPTIPQLYVAGEFVGGADIVRELEDSGELPDALGVDDTLEAPEITITDAAAEQFKAAFASDEVDDEDVLRLTIDSRFHNDLAIGPRRPGDVAVETKGLELLLDRRSARRARGLRIDFVQNEDGVGFKIDNPNAPAPVQELRSPELAARMQADPELRLYDVRSPEERAICSIEGSVLLDNDVLDELEALPKDTPLYFHCHHGVRSMRVAQHFVDRGFREIYNLAGGIDDWAQTVDPDMKRY